MFAYTSPSNVALTMEVGSLPPAVHCYHGHRDRWPRNSTIKTSSPSTGGVGHLPHVAILPYNVNRRPYGPYHTCQGCTAQVSFHEFSSKCLTFTMVAMLIAKFPCCQIAIVQTSPRRILASFRERSEHGARVRHSGTPV